MYHWGGLSEVNGDHGYDRFAGRRGVSRVGYAITLSLAAVALLGAGCSSSHQPISALSAPQRTTTSSSPAPTTTVVSPQTAFVSEPGCSPFDLTNIADPSQTRGVQFTQAACTDGWGLAAGVGSGGYGVGVFKLVGSVWSLVSLDDGSSLRAEIASFGMPMSVFDTLNAQVGVNAGAPPTVPPTTAAASRIPRGMPSLSRCVALSSSASSSSSTTGVSPVEAGYCTLEALTAGDSSHYSSWSSDASAVAALEGKLTGGVIESFDCGPAQSRPPYVDPNGGSSNWGSECHAVVSVAGQPAPAILWVDSTPAAGGFAFASSSVAEP